MANPGKLTDFKEVFVKNDPQKNLWGDTPNRNGRKLSAVVKKVPGDKGWFQITLKVESIDPSKPLTGKVTFYLHDTFDDPVVPVPVRYDAAILSVLAEGAFTVGAKVEESNGTVTPLELDLATEVPDAPRAFIEN